jgi:ATP-dependent helicase/nuclease subunit A
MMTYDQHIASDPANSVWVSASAGTGKTKVLTDRVLRLLLSGAAPSKILCITYTKAAAAEMQQRIDSQLGQWAIMEKEGLQEALAGLMGAIPDEKHIARAQQLFAILLDAPERMRIQTIHGFCQSILKRFPLEAGIPPHFSLIDTYTSQELLHEARMRLFMAANNEVDSNATQAISALTSIISESSFNDLLEEIVNARQKFIILFSRFPNKETLRESIYQAFGLHPDESIERLKQKHFTYSEEEKQLLRQACRALAQGQGDSDSKTAKAIQNWLEGYDNHEAYITAFVTQSGEPRVRLCTKEAEKHWVGLKEFLAREQQRVIAFADICRSLKLAGLTQHVVALASTLLGLYNNLKMLHGYMDYDDLITHTVQLLEQSGSAAWVLYKLDGGIDHLMVDEAQDTSPLQWKLVDIIASEFFVGEGARPKNRTLFIVGDEKQSIFSFQGAAPHAFDDMQRRLSRRTELKRVRLALSFRSTAPVLQLVDKVFAQADARDGLVFTESDISHDVKRIGMAGRVELWPLMESPEEEAQVPWFITDMPLYNPRPELLLAHSIAKTIADWLKHKRQLQSQGRPVVPGDIMILVQRRGIFADVMLRALKQYNIPVAGADRLMLTSHIAVMDLMALADFLLLPQDDLTLAVVLKSPFVGLSEEALFELAYNRGKQSLWQRLRTNKKYTEEYHFLAGLLAITDYVPPYELFAHILEKHGGRKKLAARLGNEIDDPLNELLALAIQYSQTYPPSLQGFLQWLRSGATEIKRDMENGGDAVRIMTVHGAKGLQAPIVFLPDATNAPHYDRGILWQTSDNSLPLWSPFAADDEMHYRNLKERNRLETEQEYRRLLYVAMTRAEDELYVCGWKSSKAVSDGCWYELIKRAIEKDESWATEDTKKVLLCAQTEPPKYSTKPAKQEISQKLPGWVHIMPGQERPLSKPLAPSHMDELGAMLSPFKDNKARARGLLIHRLLQILPDIVPNKRRVVAQDILQKQAENLSFEEQNIVIDEIFNILNHPDFSQVFSEHSVAEVPVTGIVQDGNGNPLVISGQIDRLAVFENEVYIIDYKTNRILPKNETTIPDNYLKQMHAYRELVAQIYPDKIIHCALLWTAEAKLMVIS